MRLRSKLLPVAKANRRPSWFAKLDRCIQRLIYRYLHDRIGTTKDPRDFGKSLRHELKGLWRYRVGDRRILCKLEDEIMVVLVVAIAHRSKVYESE